MSPTHIFHLFEYEFPINKWFRYCPSKALLAPAYSLDFEAYAEELSIAKDY